MTVFYVIIKNMFEHDEIYNNNLLLYREDGVFETATALLSIAAGGLLLAAIKYRTSMLSKIILSLLAGLFLFFGFEEIS